MPILNTDFSPSFPFKNSHFSTIYRSLFIKENINYKRTRITTWDNDFLDLDFSTTNSNTLILLIHGLEGSSQSSYMKSSTKHLNNNGFDTVSMNLRGCSGEDNLLLETYHSGKTDDIDFVINYLIENYNYSNIILGGFSIGGNLILKYLGEYNLIPKIVKGAITFSVPVDLTSSQKALTKPKNKLYLKRFLKSIKGKIIKKTEKFPNFKIDKDLVLKATEFRHLEEQYTVPTFGFKSSEDYWMLSSSKPYLPKIKTPTLLINAKDDTFLGKECFPIQEAKNSNYFHLMMPDYGGHVGFVSTLNSKNQWMTTQMIDFINKKINLS